ncbi:MAG: hypothetical protein PHW04_09910 [Candidatus Wallbacteria bacterium]|nr:hypothetical protein [Candidatus Wallbacteria bacterium]
MLTELLKHLNGKKFNQRIPGFWRTLSGISDNSPAIEHYTRQIESILKKDLKRPHYKNTELKLIQLFLQHFTSYDEIPGTLLRTISILPLFSSCGFNSIMLLPHFLRSEKFKKGDRGSPYSVKDYYTIDPLMNELSDFSTDNLFAAFVEASHRLGIQVFLDMVPRTAARDSFWILEDPDWFYWVKPEHCDRLIELLQTEIDGIPPLATLTREYGKMMVENLPVTEIAHLFSHSPKHLYPERWENFKKHNLKNHDFLDELEREFHLITPPCTSDCANDSQPPWLDVTPLRLYQDYDPDFYEVLGRNFLEKSAPFFIQPVLKASNFKGSIPMRDLWQKIAGVCGYYADKFQLDGVRGDMFHALPGELIELITKAVPEDFVLIMENLNNKDGDELSVRHNFGFYSGNLFSVVNETAENMEYFLNETAEFKTSILAMPVIGDSPPLFSRGSELAKFQITQSAFIPNSAFGLTADTLLENDLPLNFGLGFSKEMQEEFLEKMDKAGRKIAYFNHDFLTDCWDRMSNQKLEFVQQLISTREKIFGSADWELLSTDRDDAFLSYRLRSGKKEITVFANFPGGKTQVLVCPAGKKVDTLFNSTLRGDKITLKSPGIAIIEER